MKSHVINRYPASQCRSDRVRNSVSQLVNCRTKQKEDEQNYGENRKSALRSQKFHFTIRRVRRQRVWSKK